MKKIMIGVGITISYLSGMYAANTIKEEISAAQVFLGDIIFNAVRADATYVIQALRIVIARFNVNLNLPITKNGDTCLHIAACRGHTNTVDILLQLNADKNIANKEGNTPLHVAAQQGHYHLIDILASPHTINYSNNNKQTPLMLAAHNNYSTAIIALARQGGSVKEVNISSAMQKHTTNVLQMLKKKSNPQRRAQKMYEQDPNKLAIEPPLARNIEGKKGFKMLLREAILTFFAYLIENDKNNFNFFMHDLGFLRKTQVNINAPLFCHPDQPTLLHITTQCDNKEAVTALLNSGASPQEVNFYGETPAKYTSNPSILDLLSKKSTGEKHCLPYSHSSNS